MKPYYQDELVTVYHGSNLDVLPLLSNADLIVTDPPYGVKKTDEYDDSSFPVEWIPLAWRVAPRILCMPGNWALMTAGAALGKTTYKQTLVLHSKNGMTHGAISFGNWIPVIAAGEWKKKPRPDVIPFIVNVSEDINHPSPKPYEAMVKLLQYYCEPNWTIVDCFMGSGTTLLAAKQLGIKAIGIELDERYCKVAASRLRGDKVKTIITNGTALQVVQPNMFTTIYALSSI